MHVKKLIIAIEPEDSGHILSSSGVTFQPQEAVVWRYGDDLGVSITGPRINKDGSLSRSAQGQWWGQAGAAWPAVALAVKEAFERAEKVGAGAPGA